VERIGKVEWDKICNKKNPKEEKTVNFNKDWWKILFPIHFNISPILVFEIFFDFISLFKLFP